MSFWDRRFVVVTGKGGVGKTTVSAALALAFARRGRRVLVAMVNAKERLSSLLEVPHIGPHNAPILPGIEAVNMTPDASLEEYGLMTFKIRAVSHLVFHNRFVRAFLRGVPGLDAWSMLGKVTYHALERTKANGFRYDTVILDAPATGHAISLLSLPRTLAEIAPPGPLRRDGRERHELLADPERTEILPVTILEEMPVSETVELIAKLRDELGLPVRRIALNAVPEERFTAEELEDLLGRDLASPADPLVRAARFDLRRRALLDEQRRRLASLVNLPTVELPMICQGRLRRLCVERIADGLVAGIS